MQPAFSPPAPQIFLRHRSPFEVLAIRYFVTTVLIRLCVNQPEISSFNALSEVDATNLPVDNAQCGSYPVIQDPSAPCLECGGQPTFRPKSRLSDLLQPPSATDGWRALVSVSQAGLAAVRGSPRPVGLPHPRLLAGIGEAATDSGLAQDWPRESDASAKESQVGKLGGGSPGR